MKKMTTLVMMVALTACGGGGKQDVKTTANATNTVNASVLVIAEASLSATVDGKPMELALGADGVVMANGEKVGSVTPEGEVRDAKGEVTGRVAADGKVTLVSEPQEDIVVREDGGVVSRGEVIFELDATNVLVGKLVSQQDAQITYKGPPGARRAMMVAFLSTIAPAPAEPSSGASAAPASPPKTQ